MKKILVSSGLLFAVVTSACASEENWVKRRDAIRAHQAEAAGSQTKDKADDSTAAPAKDDSGASRTGQTTTRG